MTQRRSRLWGTHQTAHMALAMIIPLLIVLAHTAGGALGTAPALAQGVGGPLSLLWNAPRTYVTTAVAWGDVNNDGDLDLAFGNFGEPSRLYRNCAVRASNDSCPAGALFALDTTWNPPAAATNGVAWSDLDGDGDLDLVLANNFQASQIYLNSGAGLPSVAGKTLPSGGVGTTSIAIGDVNGAGGPDILLGANGDPSQLYLNNGVGTFAPAPGWTPAGFPSTNDVAMGDIDGDGSLDIILANSDEVSQLYTNNGGGTFTLASWTPTVFGKTTSVAVGDLDGDTRLDVVIGNNGTGAQIYLNAGGALPNAASATLAGSPTTASVALGDIERDGDLDLILGNNNQASQLYRNDGSGALALDAAWAPSSSAQIDALAWGDADGDGNLDLAMGNKDQVSLIYRNEGAAQIVAGTLAGEGAAAQRKAAFADVDNDGDLDLALGNKGAASQLYRNNGSAGFSLDAWAPATASTNAVAWGDVDHDGDLDLAQGNTGAASRLYRNNGSGTLTLDAWAPAATSTNAVAWGDVNHDGWLDLLIGNTGAASQIYLNDGSGGLSAAPIALDQAATTTSLALGDINNDGDLDLVLGNSQTGGNLLYRNCTYPDGGFACPAGSLFLRDPSFAPAPFDTFGVALGDVDGDGDLDLAAGNSGNPSQLYINDGSGVLTLGTAWQPAPANTNDISFGDMDGDQDLDLLISNQGQASQIYRNDGGGRLTLMPASAALGLLTPTTFAATTGSAWGDLNGDGSLDIVLANIATASQIYLNGGGGIATPINRAPSVSIRQPTASGQAGPAGGLLAAGAILDSTTITLRYTLRDAESDRVGAVRGFFSLDGGGTWQQATPLSTTVATNLNLTTSPAGIEHIFTWDVYGSSFFGQSDTVLFQIRAYPLPVPAGVFGAPQRVSGPFQRPFVAASTALFRARGRQVQVLNGDTGSTPAPNAVVYRVPAGQERGAPLVAGDRQPFRTDASGYLSGRAALNEQDRIAALMPVDLPDSSSLKGNVELYYSSPISISSGLPESVVQRGASGVQVLRVAASRPLALFNLTVGLEWDASSDEQYLTQLQYNLRRASEFLYDWTDGQAALGQLTITYGAATIENANIRIYATNRLRPWAFQGGVVSQTYTETLTLPAASAPKTIIYNPGYLAMGSIWSRYGDSVSFGDDWPRALAHELGHYALFLDDNYIGRDADDRLISVDGCQSAMGNPYRDDYSEFHPESGWSPPCAQTLSNVETGRSDWSTIKRFYDSSAPGFTLKAPQQFNANPGPSSQPLAFTQISLPAATSPSGTLSAPVFSLVRADGSGYSYAPGSRVRAVRYTDGGRRVVDLGRPNLDQLIARGTRVGDTICVYDPTSQVAGCADVQASTAQIRLLDQPGWQPDIQINPLSDTQVEIIVSASGVVPIGQAAPTLRAQFFNNALPISDTTTLTLSLPPGATSYRATLNLSQSVYGGYLRLGTNVAPGAAGWHESITEYQLIGQPLAAAGALARAAPTAGPDQSTCQPPFCSATPTPKPATSTKRAPLAVSSDGQMLIYGDQLSPGQFYSLQTAAYLPPTPPWSALVGQAYRLYTRMTAADLAAKKVAITSAYLESELPAGTEGGLAIYYSDDGVGWDRLTDSRFDPDRNEISTAAVGGGLYSLISRIEVRPGWNNISYPWPSTQSVLAATQRLNITPRVHFTTIHSYEPSDINDPDPWKVYDVDAPGWVNSLGQLAYGKGYWFIVPPGGGTPPVRQTPALASGVPVPPATIYGLLPYHAAPAQAGLKVEAISNGIVCSTDQTRVVAGQQVGFLIKVFPAGQGAVEGCGINGQPITIMVGGTVIGHATWDNSRPITFRDTFLPMVFQQ